MTVRKHRLTTAIAMGAIALLLIQASAFADSQPRIAAVSEESPAATIEVAHFAEPLVRTGPTTATEDGALARAIAVYEHRSRPEDLRSLEGFLKDFPHSNWSAALHTNIGLSSLHYGYFSRAIDAWQKAWTEGRTATDPRAKALVDRAVGELALLYASLGKIDTLNALFIDIGTRPISGSATESVQVARETLSLAEKDPRHLFICGPMALRSLMLEQGAPAASVDFLQWYRAEANGTTLAEVAALADKAKFDHRLVFRQPGQAVPVPSVVHWKLGHFAAIVGEANGRLHVEDPSLKGQSLWITPEALDSEASGYFLVPRNSSQQKGWRSVATSEAGNIRGKGPSTGTRQGNLNDRSANPPGNCPLCGYNIAESSVAVTLSDEPGGYIPAIGPSAKVRIAYNQRQDSQPANLNFFNVSPKWTLNLLSFVTDDPTNVGANVSRYLSSGSSFTYLSYNSTTKSFAAQDDDGSILIIASQTPVVYQRKLGDGGVEIYSQSDGSTGFPRHVFLTQIVDPQGNALTLNYDSQLRVTSVTDAVGRNTTLSYGVPTWPKLVTQITDPFGRSATLTYDTSGRLASITDILGLTSSFSYDANSLVNALTTPYGTTTFAYTAPGTSSPPRFVQVTDPMGFHEREEWLEPSSTPASDPTASLPTGMPITLTNNYLQYRDSYHWDKTAYVTAGCTPTGGCDYTKARNTHFAHMPGTTIKGTAVESIKYPLENRIWFSYAGQPDSFHSGTFDAPIAIGRVLDDGSTQLKQTSYDSAAYFNPTQMTDPLGRITAFTYANHIDVQAITQTIAGTPTVVAQFNYNYNHQPVTYTDASGQTTNFAYNEFGQPTSITNALGQTTKYQYDSSKNLITVTNANNVTAATYTYDSYARMRTFTDSEGWAVTYDYDAADRVTKVTYPDGTSDTYTYKNLDLVSYLDRQARRWTYAYDANRRLTATTDPRKSQTQLGYNERGQITTLTDPSTNVTAWAYDVQGRLTSKQYADTTTVTYAYENTTSRLKSVTDALGQVKTFSYANDDLLLGVTYLSAVHTTPNVSFTYDPYFPRRASMTDGTGTTQYTYGSVGSLGALQIQQEASALASSAITYSYDALGRLASRTVQGAGAETFQYDAIGRLTTHASDLGSFTLGYLGQTGQMTGRALASSTLATTWSYLGNTNDRRLSGIGNVGLSSGQFSNYTFTTTPENFISASTESNDTSTVYPATGAQTATYNNLNQLTNLSGQALTFDSVGNVTSDGQRNYTWDAENRLIGITYPGATGKATAFTYDGLGRRVTISSTPAGGGSATVTSYLWCGDSICQARNAGNATTRSYYEEGEFVPGTPGQPYYYGTDQLGSVRRAFASASSAPAYSYDPYGVPLQATAPVTDFVYAGMFYNADSGLYLTNYRAFDPVAGRWLSRDPLGEMSDPVANLYAYVGGNPVYAIDTSGLAGPDNLLTPSSEATGPHSSFRRATDQSIQNYQTYDKNPYSGGFSPTKRFRGIGGPHGEVEPPMCYDPKKGPFGPSEARPAEPWEIPQKPSVPIPENPSVPIPIGPALRMLGVGSGLGIGLSIFFGPSPAY